MRYTGEGEQDLSNAVSFTPLEIDVKEKGYGFVVIHDSRIFADLAPF